MPKNNISNSFNESSLDQVSIQSKNVSQAKLASETDKMFAMLIEEIKGLKEGQEEAEHFAQELKKAFDEKNESKFKKFYGFLNNKLHEGAALASIYSAFFPAV